MAENVKGEMIRGQIDTVILLALVDGDKDSNEIRTAIETKSDNKYCVKQGTFYSAMQRLVEKGYIKEYRSSAVDGIRRKYYSLNPKGKKFLDKNIEQWTASKALVDNLMDTETPTPVEEKPQVVETPTDEFEEFKALTTESIGDFSVDEPVEDNSYFDKLGNDVLSDLNSELEKLSVQEEPETVEEEMPKEETLEDEKVEKTEGNTEDFIDVYENVEDGESSESYDFEELDTTEEIPEEIDEGYEEYVDYDEPLEDNEELVETEETALETPFVEPINVEDSNSEVYNESLENEENSFVEEENQSDNSNLEIQEEISYEEVNTVEEEPQYVEVVEEVENAKDDMLVVQESVPTNGHEYRRILGRLYPKTDEPKQTVKDEKVENKEVIKESTTSPKTVVSYEYVTFERETEKEEKVEDVEEVNVSTSTQFTPPATVIEENQPIETKTDIQEPTDFSDIYAKARREGFKVKTSFNTNSFSGSEILISKLRLHSSILLYLFLVIQCVLLDFSLSSILNMQLNTKLIILGCLASFPIFCLLMYVVNRKHTVYDVIPFKDAISAALIITFQLTIIILCVALFVNVDFNNFKEVSTFIVLPFVLVLNIPVYFIFKYTLLSTGRYFTED